MGIMKWAAAAVLLAASLPAVAYDAVRCAQARSAIARLQDNLRHGPTASDRAAFEAELSMYVKAEIVECGSGSAAGVAPGGKAPASIDGLVDPLQRLGAVLARDPSDWRPAPTGPALPAPPQPTGSVSGPMTMRRLGGTGPADASGASSAAAGGTQAPAPRPLEAATASRYPTDHEIGLRCATAANPSTCELALQSERDHDPGYQQWKAAESARMDRNIDKAMADVDDAFAASQQPQPYDNSDPALARCREGEKAPWTIAGCYDLGAKPPPRKLVKKPREPEMVGTPSNDAEMEAKVMGPWKKNAAARLLQAMQAGQVPVPEDIKGRDDCKGAWMYDGLSAGTCGDWSHKVVYEVEVPQLPPVSPPQVAGQQVATPPKGDDSK